MRQLLGLAVLSIANLLGAPSEVADAVMSGNKAALRTLLLKKTDVNTPQMDGTTAMHWAVRSDDLETTGLLIRGGGNVSAANRDGASIRRSKARFSMSTG